jgi:hypothetical protein
MRRRSTWMIPVLALSAIVAGVLVLNAGSPTGSSVASRSTSAGRTGSADFPPPETSVTVTRRGETMQQPASATGTSTTQTDAAMTSSELSPEPAPATTRAQETRSVPPISGSTEATGPGVAAATTRPDAVRSDPTVIVRPRRSTTKTRGTRAQAGQAERLSPMERDLLKETAPADQVEREAARRTAEIRRTAAARNDDQGGDAAAQIVSRLSPHEMQDLMDGRMTTTDVATKIRYHGSRTALRKAILQLRDERSGHMGGG